MTLSFPQIISQWKNLQHFFNKVDHIINTDFDLLDNLVITSHNNEPTIPQFQNNKILKIFDEFVRGLLRVDLCIK